MKPDNLCILNPDDTLSESRIWQWYLNVYFEVSTGFLNKDQQSYLMDYYSEAGLLRGWRCPFFRYHYAGSFTASLKFLLSGTKKKPFILDLGCGTGTQTLAFALMGAKVLALDMDDSALDILRKRIVFYERKANRTLDIRVQKANVFNFDFESIGPVDGMYSLFAFNMMQPSTKLISMLVRCLSDECRIVILDGNRTCWVPRLFAWRRRCVLSPVELRDEFVKCGFLIHDHYGGVVFPPALWFILPYTFLSRLDSWIGRQSWLYPISHQIMVQRG